MGARLQVFGDNRPFNDKTNNNIADRMRHHHAHSHFSNDAESISTVPPGTSPQRLSSNHRRICLRFCVSHPAVFFLKGLMP